MKCVFFRPYGDALLIYPDKSTKFFKRVYLPKGITRVQNESCGSMNER